MIYFKNQKTGEVFAYETKAEREQFGSGDLAEMSESDIEVHINPPPTPDQIVAQYTGTVQQHLDAFARTRNYDGILSAATYATSIVPKFKVEGQYAVEARDSTWAKCYEVLAAVEAGTRPMPTMEELIGELPELVWPQ